jgi:hypothetical protein
VRERLSSLPLVWRVFATNATALILATGALVLAPVKLGMRDRVELTRYAIRRGLVQP